MGGGGGCRPQKFGKCCLLNFMCVSYIVLLNVFMEAGRGELKASHDHLPSTQDLRLLLDYAY